MRRIGLAVVLALSLALALVPFAADGQRAERMPHVGLLGIGSAEPSPRGAFREALRERGYVEGQNIVLDDHASVDHYDRLPGIAAELVQQRVDVLVTIGATATKAAKKATDAIPIVTVGGFDPVEAGLAASLARPGGNVTGVSTIQHELFGKRLELLKETLPRIRRVAALFNADSDSEVASLRNAEMVSQSIDLRLHPVGVRRSEDLEKAFAAMLQRQAEALITVASTMLAANRTRIIELAEKHKLPTMLPGKAFVEAGGLMSYGADSKDSFRKAA
jgi:putative ABC transport system substrate-binding protein